MVESPDGQARPDGAESGSSTAAQRDTGLGPGGEARAGDEVSHARLPAGPAGPRQGCARREHVFWPAFAVVMAAVIYAFLPEGLLVGPRVLIPALEAALLLAMLLTSRATDGVRARFSRLASIALATVVIVANLVSLGMLVAAMNSEASGPDLLLGAMQVWCTGIIGFALLYWEIDRGGPVARHTRPRHEIALADWRFSQDENDDSIGEVADGSSEKTGWMPRFVDYFYLSVTNSSAFSPTDTMPLSSRAKMLMALQSTAALLTSLLVVARAVGSFGGGGG